LLFVETENLNLAVFSRTHLQISKIWRGKRSCALAMATLQSCRSHYHPPI
jgi:hypothetical protein